MELRLPLETLRAVWSLVVSWFVISKAQRGRGDFLTITAEVAQSSDKAQ